MYLSPGFEAGNFGTGDAREEERRHRSLISTDRREEESGGASLVRF